MASASRLRPTTAGDPSGEAPPSPPASGVAAAGVPPAPGVAVAAPGVCNGSGGRKGEARSTIDPGPPAGTPLTCGRRYGVQMLGKLPGRRSSQCRSGPSQPANAGEPRMEAMEDTAFCRTGLILSSARWKSMARP